MKFSIDKTKIIRGAKLVAKPVIAVAISATMSVLFANQISDISAKLSEAQTLSYTLQKRLEVVSQMRDDLAKIGDKNYGTLENALVSANNITDIIVEFERLGSRHSMDVNMTLGSGFKPVAYEVQHGEPIAPIDYSLTTRAGISAYVNFLKAFEALHSMPTVRNLEIGSEPPAGWGRTANITMRGEIFVSQD